MQTEHSHHNLPRLRFPGTESSDSVRPLITTDNRPHYEGLRAGKLLLPKCGSCGKVGRPSGYGCPWCGDGDRGWAEVTGEGLVHSRVRYHRAYLPAYQPLVPYVVAAVRLLEGPVLMGRWLSSGDMPEIGSTACAAIEEWSDGFCGLSFIEGSQT